MPRNKGKGRSKKKGGGGSKKYALRDVRMYVKQKNYKTAYRMLVNADVKDGQEREAADLRALLLLGQATDSFKEKDYRGCIIYLDNNAHQVPDNALFEQKMKLLKGLAYFYSAQYVDARSLLSDCADDAALLPYHFYFLLSKVYDESEDLDYSDLKDADKLPVAQQDFLRTALLLRHKNYAEAETALTKIKTENETQAANQSALSDILRRQPKAKLDKRVKPLYRAMSSAGLSETESDYLRRFPVLTDNYHLSGVPIPTDEIREVLVKLCEHGEALDADELEMCLRAPEELHPSILYNQAAILVNEDWEDNEKEVRRLIVENYRMMCRVPEFIYLFCLMVCEHPENYSSNQIKNTILAYTEHFADKMTDAKAEEMSRQIVFTASRLDTRSITDLEIIYISVLQSFPESTPIKWSLFKMYSYEPAGKPDWKYLNIFNRPLSKVSKDFVRESLEESLSSMLLAILDVDRDIYYVAGDLGEKILINVFKMWEELLDRHPPLTVDNFPLEVLSIAADVMFYVETRGIAIGDADTYFIEIYSKYIDYFSEPADSAYRAYLKLYQEGKGRNVARRSKGSSQGLESKMMSVYRDLESEDAAVRREAAETSFLLTDIILKAVGLSDSLNSYIVETVDMLRSKIILSNLQPDDVEPALSAVEQEIYAFAKSKNAWSEFSNLAFDVLEKQLAFRLNDDGVKYNEMLLKVFRRAVMQEEYIGTSAREILQEYFDDLTYWCASNPHDFIDKKFLGELVDFLLEIENKSRRRKFKGVLNEFKNEVL